MVSNKKKRKTRTNNQCSLEISLERKKMKFTQTITLAVLIITLTIIGAFGHASSQLLRSMKRKAKAKKRKPRLRISWTKENARFSNRMFYRLFRMHRACFVHLCEKIERSVGEKEFKSEKYIDQLAMEGHLTKEGGMMAANLEKTGPYILGEVKVAMT